MISKLMFWKKNKEVESMKLKISIAHLDELNDILEGKLMAMDVINKMPLKEYQTKKVEFELKKIEKGIYEVSELTGDYEY